MRNDIYLLVILLLYVLGVILFLIAPIYRYFDRITPNISYLEIAATGGFVIANTMLLISVIIRKNKVSTYKFVYKCFIFTGFILGASSFLSGAAYRLVDSKTLVNVYIDLMASCLFTITGTVELAQYIKKSCRGEHKLASKPIYKYSLRIWYLLGALLFLVASIYRIIDYITDNTLFIDIVAIAGFFIPNTMMFIAHVISMSKASVK